jgi:hypothetical protein
MTARVADSQRRRSRPPSWIANRASKCAAGVVEADGSRKPSTSVSRVLGACARKQRIRHAKPIEIDYSHSRAILQEVGERLRTSLKQDPELPASLRLQIDRFRQLEGQSQPNVARPTTQWLARRREAKEMREGRTAAARSRCSVDGIPPRVTFIFSHEVGTNHCRRA